MNRFARLTGLFLAAALMVLPTQAQDRQEHTLPARSPNLEVLSHVPLGAQLSVTDVIVEQDMDRPFAYAGRMLAEKGFDIIDLTDPEHAKVIHRWRIPNEDLHSGLGGMDPKYFKHKGRYYVVQSLQFFQGPDTDAGAVVVDVTGLPDVSTVKTVGFVRADDTPGGFHNIFMYKHSDGRPMLFATTTGDHAKVYDLGAFVDGDQENALVGKVPVPDLPTRQVGAGLTYHDFYVGFHPDSQQDRFYGGGTAGYYVYDVTDIENPELIVTLTGIPGVNYGHTFTPSPDGRYVVAETEYTHAPLRIYDLQPALDGEVSVINDHVGVWTADWRNLVHNHEVRWPYVFVSGYEDGLLVFDMMDPTNPTTVAFYDTFLGKHQSGMCQGNICNGAFGIDVRNADGLIVVTDMGTGFWAFRLADFQGWHGRGWGMPNVSSAQHWDEGPDGLDRPDGTH